jgi:hypothetical protein
MHVASLLYDCLGYVPSQYTNNESHHCSERTTAINDGYHLSNGMKHSDYLKNDR